MIIVYGMWGGIPKDTQAIEKVLEARLPHAPNDLTTRDTQFHPSSSQTYIK